MKYKNIQLLLSCCFLQLCISGNLALANEFSYTTITVGGKELKAKYIEFKEPLRAHSATGFDIKGDVKNYPQWVDFIKVKKHSLQLNQNLIFP